MSIDASIHASPATPLAPQRPRSRAGLWLLGFGLLFALALWAGIALTQQLWAAGPPGSAWWPGWENDFEVILNGEPWGAGEGLKALLGGAVAVIVLGGLVLLALTLLPVTLGVLALVLLLPLGLLLLLLALPVLLVVGVLALLLSPLLLLGGLAWMLFA